jgi:hypothetical protein
LFPIQLICTYTLFLPDKTKWYKNQWLKYTVLGAVLALATVASHLETISFINGLSLKEFSEVIKTMVLRKAFYTLFPLGMLIVLMYMLKSSNKYFSTFSVDKLKLKEILIAFISLITIGLVLEKDLLVGFSSVWMLVFFSLIPLEWIFQSISRLRSKRNIIYTMYILVCLLDSHFEGRLRIVGKMFLDDEILKYINQM